MTADTAAAEDRDALRARIEDGPATVVYDGDCPFCSNFVSLSRLRQTVGAVDLVNAREDDALAAALWDAGYDLDEGMVLILDGEVHYGADAMRRITLLSSDDVALNRLMRGVLGHERVARLLYPVLKTGRRLTLTALGRGKIR